MLREEKWHKKQQPERMAKSSFAILPGFYPAVYQIPWAAATSAGLRRIWRFLSDQALDQCGQPEP
ncbi:hypothetical protein C7293_13055 [filamentous cyanobacterium CCT1]|nr:hypothetical protein C7293_13055 [filamentous cyanobacterium CCT1]PSN78260.1 hypothetical protein C8B47_17805 [filamentous cyanobacterium CCP4]